MISSVSLHREQKYMRSTLGQAQWYLKQAHVLFMHDNVSYIYILSLTTEILDILLLYLNLNNMRLYSNKLLTHNLFMIQINNPLIHNVYVFTISS